MKLSRVIMAAVLGVLLAAGAMSGAQAQQPTSLGQQATTASGWSFNIAPYVWTPTLRSSVNLDLPPALGGTASASTTIGFADLLPHLDFGVMVAADAHYNQFSVLTDFMYMKLSDAGSHVNSVTFAGLPRIPITAAAQAHVGLNLNAKIWTLAGGYTLVQGDWGNFDVIAGFRFLGIPVDINYNLSVSIKGPRGNGATFGGAGSISGTADIWNAIGGFRGRIRIADTGFFIPYYFDAGTGGSELTWQIASGVGYHAPWFDVSATYRYLSFEQDGNAVVQKLSMSGPMLTATFSF
jgi:hypothetical protein